MVVKDREMARQRRRAFIFFLRSDTHAVLKPLDGSDAYQPMSLVDELDDYYKELELQGVGA